MTALGHLSARVLKIASQRLVAAVGGIEAAAALTGHGKSVVGRWTNRNEDDRFVNIADLAEIEAHAPRPMVTEALCKLAGGLFVPLPQCPGGSDALPLAMVTVAQELGDVSHKLTEGLGDGMLDPAEAQAALAELDEMDRASARLRLLLARVAYCDGENGE